MTNPGTRPQPEILKTVLDLGAMGLITDFSKSKYDNPDSIQWVNACTDDIDNYWHVQTDNKPFICFSVRYITFETYRR